MSEWLIGFDEETVYLRRAQYPTAEAATAEFRRLSVDEMGFDLSDIEDIRAVAITAPEHRSDDSACYHATCDCPAIDLWEFAP